MEGAWWAVHLFADEKNKRLEKFNKEFSTMVGAIAAEGFFSERVNKSTSMLNMLGVRLDHQNGKHF